MFSKITKIVAIIATVLTIQSCTKSSDSTTKQPSPTASFTFTASGDVAPETVTFTNTSSNATSSSWNFGDNTTSTSISPTHVFTTSGTYTVTLTVTNSSGTNSTSQIINVGNAVQTPIASFTYSGANTFAPDIVTFTNTSTNATSYLWNFGDGNTSTIVSPSHTFTTSGTFTVTLTATNSKGSNSSSQVVNVLAIQPPTASFTYSGANTFAPDNVSFVSTSTSATSFSWNFGDNSSVVTTANASHVFTNAGVYTVTLTVTNAGGSNSVSQTINVSPAPTKVELDTIVLNATGVMPSTTNYNAYIKIVQVSTSNTLTTSNNFSLIYPNKYNLFLTGSSFYTFTGIGSSSAYQIQVYQATGIFSSDVKLGFITFNPYLSATSGNTYYPRSINFVNGGTDITLKVKWLP